MNLLENVSISYESYKLNSSHNIDPPGWWQVGPHRSGAASGSHADGLEFWDVIHLVGQACKKEAGLLKVLPGLTCLHEGRATYSGPRDASPHLTAII